MDGSHLPHAFLRSLSHSANPDMSEFSGWLRLQQVLCTLLLSSVILPASAGHAQSDAEYFENQVLPLLKDKCFDCHSHEAGEANGNLMLDSAAAISAGGTRGPAINMAQLAKSPFVVAVTYEDPELQMPPDGKLNESEMEILKEWILAGAAFPDHLGVKFSGGEETIDPSEHWAYLPLGTEADKMESTPDAPLDSTIKTNFDKLVQENLAEAGLGFSPTADRVTLIRRLYYDLTGLPPTYEATQEFVSSELPTELVFENTLNRLLSSPKFGERWARYWMDLARYADNKGYVFREDREYPEAYRYREWLINAFNADLPYDQFVTYQLAADKTKVDSHSNLPALGFVTLGRRFLNNQLDIIDDRIDVVSRGLMGMTLACARCHDHKYDPLTQGDYYALAGVFLNSKEPGGEPFAHRLQDAEKMRDSHILVRGSVGQIGPKVERQFVRFLGPDKPPFSDGSGRLELAQEIVSTNNPLTARVIANRIWSKLLGSSLVESPSDFGLRCPKPKQLRLLDSLANYLIQHQWNVKALVRHIMQSHVYQQSSQHNESAFAADPANELYWKMNRKRLDFEGMRDTLLVRTGQLNEAIGGKSERIDQAPFSYRRTLYAYIDRQNLPAIFRTFDMASPDVHCPKRAETSVPQQGLFALNSRFVAELASACSNRITPRPAAREQRRAAISQLFRDLLGRDAQHQEVDLVSKFLEQQADVTEPGGTWDYGYGRIATDTGNLESFERLPICHEGSWQGGKKLPDTRLGWCLLNAQGGHPGKNSEFAVIRRWTAPHDGEIHIDGELAHSQKQGNGVRGSLLIDQRSIEEWSVHQSAERTFAKVQIEAGTQIDFVVDSRGNESFDSFNWRVKIAYVNRQGESFDSEKQFSSERVKPITPWAQVIQALLASNELMFVD